MIVFKKNDCVEREFGLLQKYLIKLDLLADAL